MIGGVSEAKATILEIQRLSTEDGPGIRTTVFFKGCTLSCRWCHNPESISPRPQIHWIGNRCIGCGTCRDACPDNALAMTASGLKIDRAVCSGCGTCAEQCPAGAIERLGTPWSLGNLLAEVLKDRAFFERSGGGVTLGGGEPLFQAAFAAALLAELKAQGVHTAVDTCGHCAWESLAAVLPHTDLLLFDLKLIDSAEHARFTGAGNQTVIANLKQAARTLRGGNGPQMMWIRTPLIPGATDSERNILGTGRFIASEVNGRVQRWDLLAFNHLCRDKYRRLDLHWDFERTELLERSRMERLAEVARNSGVDPDIVHWSGSTRIETENNPISEER